MERVIVPSAERGINVGLFRQMSVRDGRVGKTVSQSA